MISDDDIWRSAMIMVKRYGDDAMLDAAARARCWTKVQLRRGRQVAEVIGGGFLHQPDPAIPAGAQSAGIFFCTACDGRRPHSCNRFALGALQRKDRRHVMRGLIAGLSAVLLGGTLASADAVATTIQAYSTDQMPAATAKPSGTLQLAGGKFSGPGASPGNKLNDKGFVGKAGGSTGL